MQDLERKIINDKNFRMRLVEENFFWFFYVYFSHYVTKPSADFQKEICEKLQDDSVKFLEILAFRGSAKSAIANTAFVIWSVVTGRVKFPVVVSDTFSQAKLQIYNIKTELEENKLLIDDWGSFEKNEEWTSTNIVLPKYGTRITGRSTGQKMRGIRHKESRPDLEIFDDIENLEMVRTKEQRDKSWQWLTGEALQAMSNDGKVVLLGNLLHSDSIMMRMKKQLESGVRDGVLLEYPIVDGERILWEGMYPNMEAIEKKKKSVGDMRAWQREYLLKIIAEEGQEVKDEWIRYYDDVPEEMYSGTGVDLAISKKETADYTAMVSGKLAMIDGQPKIYIMPNPVNERYSLHETVEKAKAVSLALGNQVLTPLWVEDVAYQKAAIGEMVRAGLPAEGIKVSSDKRSRLRTAAAYVQNGTVLFPRKGCEDLIIQLTGFGVEAHDDLVDAFVYVVMGLMGLVAKEPRMTIIGGA